MLSEDLLQDLINGNRQWIVSTPTAGFQETIDERPQAIYSGSFNPLHRGHTGLHQAAERFLEAEVWFELPVVNAEKPPLAATEIVKRSAQFQRHHLLITRTALFVEKAAIFPGATFVLGYDTAARLLQPRFYNDKNGMETALNTLKDAGCDFLIAGRMLDVRYVAAEELSVPRQFANLFRFLPEATFREDVSSTELRENPSGRSEATE